MASVSLHISKIPSGQIAINHKVSEYIDYSKEFCSQRAVPVVMLLLFPDHYYCGHDIGSVEVIAVTTMPRLVVLIFLIYVVHSGQRSCSCSRRISYAEYRFCGFGFG